MAMFDFLRKFQTSRWPSAKSAAGPLILAAFGKHPGWDDHIPGIGIETDALAQLKQSLYVGGIGGQLDSGAWKKLEADKRQEGFDHVFFWLQPGHTLVGRFWSSSDGKGRKEYPMVLCVDGGTTPMESVLAWSLPELERVREACQNTRLAEEVRTACRLAQARLRAAAESPGAVVPQPFLSPGARRRFLDHGRFAPNGVGLLRVLHQLDSGAAASSNGGGRADPKGLRSSHLRLPLAGDSPKEAILLWAAFLKVAISSTVTLLFLLRSGEDWCDVIIGEPTSEDLFCLQASPQALPLVTEIPYALAPETNQRMQALVPKFLQAEFRARAADPGPPALPLPEGGQARAGPGLGLWFGVGIGVCVLGGALVAGHWLLSSRPSPEPANGPSAQPPVFSQQQVHYEMAIRDGRAAFGRTNYAEALALANVALGLKHEDPTATKLRNDAQGQLDLALAKENGQKFQAAMQAGHAAFDRSNFTEAVKQAEAALGLKTNDVAAMRLRNDAQAQLVLAARIKEEDQEFQAAMQAGRAAFEQTNFAEAMAQAGVALGLKPKEAAATKLKQDAQTQMALLARAREIDQEFQAAMKSAQVAFEQKDYAVAERRANEALKYKENDPSAIQLNAEAQAREAELKAAAARPANPPKGTQPTVSLPITSQSAVIPSPTTPPPVTRPPASSASVTAPTGALPVRSGGSAAMNFTNDLGMEFVHIQESAGHGFWVGKYEVTQQQFSKIMGQLPDSQPALGGDFPVANVPLQDAQEFCRRLGDKDGRIYRLPSKAEWLEVAGLPNQALEQAWTELVASGILQHEVTSWHLTKLLDNPHPVGSLGAQTNQVCDLFGNVREWVIGENGAESAGFAYNSLLLSAGRMFLQPSPDTPSIAENTGLRCLLVDNK